MRSKIEDVAVDAIAYARIDALWRRTKKKRGAEITPCDWAYRDGIMAARALFGTTHKVRVPRKANKALKALLQTPGPWRVDGKK